VTNKIFLNILPENQRVIYEKLADSEFINKYYLAGGTSLALQIGHRISIDFDFFSQKDIDLYELKNDIVQIGKIEIFQEKKNTLHCSIDGIKISFISYKYKMIESLRFHKNIAFASMFDIACMKLSAISSRGCKKDFIDLYYLLKSISLEKIIGLFKKKFGGAAVNEYQLKKSLIYFEDAENEPMPKMKKNISWDKIKDRLIAEVKRNSI